jgi:hypothetical protein
MTYRISFGIQPEVWGSVELARLNRLLTPKEISSISYVRATLIFYTEDPDRIIGDLIRDSYTLTDFRWINISREA